MVIITDTLSLHKAQVQKYCYKIFYTFLKLQELILSHLGTAGWGSVDYVNLEEIVEEQESRVFIEALQRWGKEVRDVRMLGKLGIQEVIKSRTRISVS